MLDVMFIDSLRLLLNNADGFIRIKDTYVLLLRLVWKDTSRRLDVMSINNLSQLLSIAIGLETIERLYVLLDVSKLRWLPINATIAN